jgi:hypothetical protein
VNLFKNVKLFNNYKEVYGEIIRINEQTSKYYEKYKNLVNFVQRQSFGTSFDISMKLPKEENQQYRVILRIFEKMFKNDLTPKRVESILQKVDLALH